MTCWETIAELLHETRSDGKFSIDAIALLKEELGTLENEQLRLRVEEITSTVTFGDSQSLSDVFQLLSSTEEFRREVCKIVAARLVGARDA